MIRELIAALSNDIYTDAIKYKKQIAKVHKILAKLEEDPITLLRTLDEEAAAIRQELNLHGKGEVVWHGEDVEDYVEVYTDGYGKYIVSKFTPWGCEILNKASAGPFDNLSDAIAAAEKMCNDEYDEDEDEDEEEEDDGVPVEDEAHPNYCTKCEQWFTNENFVFYRDTCVGCRASMID